MQTYMATLAENLIQQGVYTAKKNKYVEDIQKNGRERMKRAGRNLSLEKAIDLEKPQSSDIEQLPIKIED